MEPTDRNLRAWEDVHRRAPEPETGLPAAVRDRLPELAGRHVLQLGGQAGWAAELAELGALVTAVHPAAATFAAEQESASTVAWIQADIHALPLELRRGRFQLVLADASALGDVGAWAEGVEAALRRGGYVLVHGPHPAATCLDPFLRWRDDYFGRSTAGLGQLVTAAARAGLLVRRLEELRPAEAGRRPPPFPAEFVLVAARPAP